MLRSPLIEKIDVDAIAIAPGRRPVDEGAAKSLAESMGRLGLKTPITLWGSEAHLELVAGAHRLAAARILGWSEIDCFILDAETVSREEAEMWEISENLHRAELTVLQRSEQVARWVELAAKVAQLGQPPGGKQPKESGIAKAARELNTPRQEVQRAKKIASLSPEAKDAAQETGLADNQSALLEAAKMPVSEQAKAIRNRASSPPSKHPQDDTERSTKWRRSFEKCWNAAPSPVDREWALNWVDRPIMDGIRAA